MTRKECWRKAVSAVGILVTLGAVFGAGVAQAASPSSGPSYPQCPTTHGEQACIYGVNNSQSFTGPGTLSTTPPTFYLYATDDSNADNNGDEWPSTWSAPVQNPQCDPRATGQEWCARFYAHNSGDSASAWYMPSGVIPGWGGVWIYEDNPDGTSPNQAKCTTLAYVACTAQTVADPTAGGHANYIYTINNLPVTVQINNNFDAPITLDGQPISSPTMLQDPNGSSAATIAPGGSGYFGMYQPANSAALPASAPVFAAKYTIANTTRLSKNALFLINVVSTGSGGVSAAKSSCLLLEGSNSDRQMNCTPQVTGNPGQAQTIIFNLNPQPQPPAQKKSKK